MNYVRTFMLMAGLTALFGAVGYLLGGSGGMLIALAIAAATNLYSYWNSDKLALAAYNAQEVDERSAPELYGMVRDLAARANMPMPRVYLIEEDQPNAFATGRNPENAAVAATTGILRTLSYEELAGVMAHELAHIKNHDTLTMTITATMAGAISSLDQLRHVLRLAREPAGPARADPGLGPGAAGGDGHPDGDLALARIRGRQARRRDRRQSGLAGRCARQDRRRRRRIFRTRRRRRSLLRRTCSSSIP